MKERKLFLEFTTRWLSVNKIFGIFRIFIETRGLCNCIGILKMLTFPPSSGGLQIMFCLFLPVPVKALHIMFNNLRKNDDPHYRTY